MMSLAWFGIAVLGVWRITHLLAVEDGPGGAIARLRSIARGHWYELLTCFYCTSMWVAGPFALAIASTWSEQLLAWPALSGAAIVLDRLVERASASPAAFYVEDPHPNPGVAHHDLLPR